MNDKVENICTKCGKTYEEEYIINNNEKVCYNCYIKDAMHRFYIYYRECNDKEDKASGK